VKKTRAPFPKSLKTYGKGPVRYALPLGPQGPLQVGIDFRFAPVPGAYYYADALSLRHDRELAMATLLFGHIDAAAGRLRDRLDIIIPEGALFFQFWNSSREVEKTLDEQLKALGLPASTRLITQKSLARTTLFANTIFVATGGGESCLDFYYLPVRDIHIAKTNHGEIGLEPIIRVLCSPALLKLLFDMCRPHAVSAPGQPAEVRRSDRASAS
jgi:hypothetical protein